MFVTLKCKLFTDDSGAFTEIPGILTPAGWLEPALDYCLHHSINRSPNWMVKVNRSIGLFLEYLAANPNEKDSYQLFQNFAQRLYIGTFDRVSGLDPSWLCWRPRSATQARTIIRHLTDFFDWLNQKRPASAVINPHYSGNIFDRIADEAAYQYRRDRAFLGHTWLAHLDSGDPARPATAHFLRARRSPKVETNSPPAFPDERFLELLTKGFVVGGKENFRDMLITLLLHGSGFRYSEPFHLYVEDVLLEPGSKQARVQIHHPSDGYAPKCEELQDEHSNKKTSNRMAYLGERYGLTPRHMLLDSHAAGWKGNILDGKWYMRAYWFVPKFGELFLTLWYRYLEQIARIERHHPFAWINQGQEPKGGMYCMMQYWRSHARACERIGLVVGKELGTTPHGHRHAYGRRLVAGGFSAEMIRRFMHHLSLESQKVYTTPTSQQIVDALVEGAERLDQKYRRDS